MRAFRNAFSSDIYNYNVGILFTPLKGLNLTADAWKIEIDDLQSRGVSLGNSSAGDDLSVGLPQIFRDKVNRLDILENPFTSSGLQSNGIDLGASYIWKSDKFGQFVVSTKATYVHGFNQDGRLMDIGPLLVAQDGDTVISPELQSSLMLSWQKGNHTASAITHYVNSFKDSSEIDIDELNQLVNEYATFDLQYGYSLKAGNQDKAEFSIGIRNIFDTRSNSFTGNDRLLQTPNRRMAYGSVKYQF